MFTARQVALTGTSCKIKYDQTSLKMTSPYHEYPQLFLIYSSTASPLNNTTLSQSLPPSNSRISQYPSPPFSNAANPFAGSKTTYSQPPSCVSNYSIWRSHGIAKAEVDGSAQRAKGKVTSAQDLIGWRWGLEYYGMSTGF
ncbi:hypothetical protein KCU65_g154, partial [Aureobasidium melanogenum]